jgi:branched-subunit amino acid transport protein
MSTVWLAIIVAGIGTFALRASFLAFAHRMAAVPPWAQRVLRQIPPAALAALVVPAVLRSEGRVDLLHPRLAAAALATFVCWRTRSTTLTLVVGMATLVALEAL